MNEKSWLCTAFTQLTLCIAFYVVLNIGQPQNHTYGNSENGGRKIDMYFITVAGGSRPLEQQTLLLEQVRFVISLMGSKWGIFLFLLYIGCDFMIVFLFKISGFLLWIC